MQRNNFTYRAASKDYGPNPYVINLQKETLQNPYFRSALWTGNHLQMTLMSIPARGEIGLEMHPNLDQFLQIEQGFGLVTMGSSPQNLTLQTKVTKGYGIFIPAGTYHNLINMGNVPIKLYSIYAPPQHPKGTVHETKADADKAEHY